MLRRVISLFLIFGLFFQQVSFAQVATELNIGGYLARMHSAMTIDKFRPMHLRYFNYDINSHNFKVLIDKGDLDKMKGLSLKEETQTLLNYFLVGLTLHNESFWVNLRPDSENQIIDNFLVQTDVGRIMLETDLQLKKDTARLTSPETPEGKEYWNKLYKKAEEIYGYENITIPTLTRPWIVPGEIIIHETNNSAYVYKATLKVMLEQDYLKDSSVYNFKDTRSKALNDYSSELIRELIIPKLTKEVNSSKRYANIRQVYYSLILSRWFKNKFAAKKGLSPKGTVPDFIDRINTLDLTGLTSKEPWSKTTYFKEYQKSFKEGEYNIKEPVYTPTGQVIRSYFSGGMTTVVMPFNGIEAREARPNTKTVYELGGSALNKELVSSPLVIGDSHPPETIASILTKAVSDRMDLTFPNDYFSATFMLPLVQIFLKDFGRSPTEKEAQDFSEETINYIRGGGLLKFEEDGFPLKKQTQEFVKKRIANIPNVVSERLRVTDDSKLNSVVGQSLRKLTYNDVRNTMSNRDVIDTIRILSLYFSGLYDGVLSTPLEESTSYFYLLELFVKRYREPLSIGKTWSPEATSFDGIDYSRIYNEFILPLGSQNKNYIYKLKNSESGRWKLKEVSDILESSINDTSAAGSPLLIKLNEADLPEHYRRLKSQLEEAINVRIQEDIKHVSWRPNVYTLEMDGSLPGMLDFTYHVKFKRSTEGKMTIVDLQIYFGLVGDEEILVYSYSAAGSPVNAAMDERLQILSQLSKDTPSKIFYVVIDGLGGVPNWGKTELEKAQHPNLDELSTQASVGLMDITDIPGISPGSGPGHFAIFGYNPYKSIGRGVLDALGAGIELEQGDIIARGNFATLNEEGIITDRRAGRINSNDAGAIVKQLLSGIEIDGVKFFFHSTKEHRLSLIIRGKDLSASITDSDPGKESQAPYVIKARQQTEEAKRLAGLMNKLTEEINRRLRDNKIMPTANTVLFRGFDSLQEFPGLKSIYKVSPAAICTYPAYKGIAKILGMDVLPVSGPSLQDQVEALKSNLDKYNFFYLHIKETDKYGEDGNFDAKVKAIERVDSDIIPQIMEMMDLMRGDTLIVTGDHSTPALMKAHSWHPVPVLIYSKNSVSYDDVTRFTESQAGKGALGRVVGRDIMPLALAEAEKFEKLDGPIVTAAGSPLKKVTGSIKELSGMEFSIDQVYNYTFKTITDERATSNLLQEMILTTLAKPDIRVINESGRLSLIDQLIGEVELKGLSGSWPIYMDLYDIKPGIVYVRIYRKVSSDEEFMVAEVYLKVELQAAGSPLTLEQQKIAKSAANILDRLKEIRFDPKKNTFIPDLIAFQERITKTLEGEDVKLRSVWSPLLFGIDAIGISLRNLPGLKLSNDDISKVNKMLDQFKITLGEISKTGVIPSRRAASSPIKAINKRIKKLESTITEYQSRPKKIQDEISANEEKINNLRSELLGPDTFKSARAAKETKKLQEQNNNNRVEIFRIHNRIKAMSIELKALREKVARAEGAAGSPITYTLTEPIHHDEVKHSEGVSKDEFVAYYLEWGKIKGEVYNRYALIPKELTDFVEQELEKAKKKYGIDGEVTVKEYKGISGIGTSAEMLILTLNTTLGKDINSRRIGEDIMAAAREKVKNELGAAGSQASEGKVKASSAVQAKEIFESPPIESPDILKRVLDLLENSEWQVSIESPTSSGKRFIMYSSPRYCKIEWQYSDFRKETVVRLILDTESDWQISYEGDELGRSDSEIRKDVIKVIKERLSGSASSAVRVEGLSELSALQEPGLLRRIQHDLKNLDWEVKRVDYLPSGGKTIIYSLPYGGILMVEYDKSSEKTSATLIMSNRYQFGIVYFDPGNEVEERDDSAIREDMIDQIKRKLEIASSAVQVKKLLREDSEFVSAVAGITEQYIRWMQEGTSMRLTILGMKIPGILNNHYAAIKQELQTTFPKQMPVKIKKDLSELNKAMEESGKQLITFSDISNPDSILEPTMNTLVKLCQDLLELSGGPTITEPGQLLKHVLGEKRAEEILSGSSPLLQENKAGFGGIDFRTLPMTIKPMGSFEGLNFRLPQLSPSELLSFNFSQEIGELNKMISGGIIPSGARVQELVAAAWQKGAMEEYQSEILTLLAEICKLQEGECCEASDELKVALVVANAV